MLRVQILHLLFELLWTHAELERRSAHQLRLKAVGMQYSSTYLAKNHGYDFGLEYSWNEDVFISLESSLKAMEKNAEYGGQPEILAHVHAIERTITVQCEDSTKKALYLENFLMIALA